MYVYKYTHNATSASTNSSENQCDRLVLHKNTT